MKNGIQPNTETKGSKMRKPPERVMEAIKEGTPQLANVGSFNPAKLDPKLKPFLMAVERVFIETFDGYLPDFLGACLMVYNDAKEKQEDPEKAVADWVGSEIAVLRQEKKILH
ncbi:MAG: hypothetical protein ACI9H6_000422 [Patiriisocius sp.]